MAYVPAPDPNALTGAHQLAANRYVPVNHGLSIRVRVRCVM